MKHKIEEIVAKQTACFRSGKTRDLTYRQQILSALEEGICLHEEELYAALEADLGKSKAESYMTEIFMVLGELRAIKRNLKKWAKPKKVAMTLGTFPARSRIYQEPYGVVLVLAPWNYPFLLALSPVVGALAAGNCVVLKCSKSSPHTGKVIQNILESSLPQEVCYGVDLEVDYDAILDQEYQYIFFTGSPKVGKQIMAQAAKRLIPVSLELGGKSPCIVTESADIKLAAKRILWGKLLNAGQTCISIDYVLVDTKVKEALVQELGKELVKRYGNPLDNQGYPKIISDRHYQRLTGIIAAEKELGAVLGGEGNPESKKIAPAFLLDADFTHPSMEEEIFGPILPVIGYTDLNQAVEQVLDRPHPLATYIFSRDKKEIQGLLGKMPFGGGCVNDTILHITNHHMPFGGVGNSGMGSYHGYYSFRTFTHEKSVILGSSKVDIPIRYAPFDLAKWKLVKKLL